MGELGTGTFAYRCLGDGDPACVDGSTGTPQVVAVQARFGMTFLPSGGSAPRSVVAGSSEFLTTVNGGFEVKKPGALALLAVNGEGTVVDLKHLRAAEISALRVTPLQGQLPITALSLGLGESVELAAWPADVTGVTLAGSLPYQWQVDGSIVMLETPETLRKVRLRARAYGSTTVQVSAGGKSHTLQVQVSSRAQTLDAGVSAVDAATDAGHDGAITTDAGEADARLDDAGGP